MTSMCGKCCENKAHFLQTYFLKGPVASKAVCSKRFRDMKPLLPTPLTDATHLVRACPRWTRKTCPRRDGSLSTWSMRHQRWQIPINCLWCPNIWPWTSPSKSLSLYMPMLSCVCYSSGRTCWASMWTTDAGSLGRDSLHDWLRPEHKLAFYERFHEWFPSEACDVHRAEFVDIMTRLGPRA